MPPSAANFDRLPLLAGFVKAFFQVFFIFFEKDAFLSPCIYKEGNLLSKGAASPTPFLPFAPFGRKVSRTPNIIQPPACLFRPGVNYKRVPFSFLPHFLQNLRFADLDLFFLPRRLPETLLPHTASLSYLLTWHPWLPWLPWLPMIRLCSFLTLVSRFGTTSCLNRRS